jgi:DNA-binding PadR family transcriptional regulator
MAKHDYYEQGQLTDVAYLVLVSLTSPCHGYLIMSKIEEMTEGRASIGPASLYTTLKKLCQAGFIRLLEDVDNKKIYCITSDGIETLRVEIEKREQYAAIGKRALNSCEVFSEWEEINTDLDLGLQMG